MKIFCKTFLCIVIYFVTSVQKNQCVSFNDSMGKTTIASGQQELYAFIENLYNHTIFFNVTRSFDYKIPKIIHAIWLGSNPSERIIKNFESWQKMHPDWECKLWTDEDIKNFPLINQQFYDQSSNYGQRSDIARYEILYKYGGVYIDCDFFCLKPFDSLHQQYSFYTGVLKIGNKFVGLANGLIGSAPSHPILKQCIESMRVQPHEGKKEITASTGPGHFTRSFFSAAPECSDCIVLPASFLYPAPNTKRFQTIDQMNSYIQPESFAIHYWTNSWKEPEAKVKLRKKKLKIKKLFVFLHPIQMTTF